MLPPKVKDITNQRFGKVVALAFVGMFKHKARWKCRCDCGNESTHSAIDLRSGNTTSCGCVKASVGFTSNLKHGATVNGRSTKTYNIYRSMLQRCYDQNCKSYAAYGGRGITVCEKWLRGYDAFLADMGDCPDGSSIERVDVNAGYSKENCTWIPFPEQQKNKRNTVKYVADGVVMIQSELARKLRVHPSTLSEMRKRQCLPSNIQALTV